MLPHDNLEEFQDPANYDLEEIPISTERIAFYVELAGRVGGPALEIACGTGIVAIPVAQRGLAITGVDLAGPMLAHARRKSEALGLSAEWIQADARAFDLGRRFRFIYITGNAYQAFQTAGEQSAFLDGVRRHLEPVGVFAFETRNPSGHDLTTRLVEEHWFDYTSVEGHRVSVSGIQAYDPVAEVLHWTTYRRWRAGSNVRTRTTRIACRFTDAHTLDAQLARAGLAVRARYGDWARAPFTPASPSIISVCTTSSSAGAEVSLPDVQPVA